MNPIYKILAMFVSNCNFVYDYNNEHSCAKTRLDLTGVFPSFMDRVTVQPVVSSHFLHTSCCYPVEQSHQKQPVVSSNRDAFQQPRTGTKHDNSIQASSPHVCDTWSLFGYLLGRLSGLCSCIAVELFKEKRRVHAIKGCCVLLGNNKNQIS